MVNCHWAWLVVFACSAIGGWRSQNERVSQRRRLQARYTVPVFHLWQVAPSAAFFI